MIFLLIFGGVLILLAAALLLPVNFMLDVGDGIELTVKYAFIKRRFTSGSIKKDEKKTEDDVDRSVKKSIKTKGIQSTVSDAIFIIKKGVKKISWLIGKIVINRLFCRVTVATDDAAQTGVTYGAVCSLVYPVLGTLGVMTDISNCDVAVLADFDLNAESSIKIEGDFSIKLFFILSALISIFFGYIKKKMSNNNSIGA